MSLELISSNRSFNGHQQRYRHSSVTLHCDMQFAIYLPDEASSETPLPVVYWLSGLTCNEENFIQKAGAQRIASELGLIIVAPDTSPRGASVADDPNQSYDLGLGAGFYVNATQEPWAKHYQMYDYIVQELPELIESQFPATTQRSICGHSMGGHGALVIALRNAERYTSVSAFSPITNPSNCPWGKKALTAYLGDNTQAWANYDASVLMATSSATLPALVDQGTEDEFLEQELKPNALENAAVRSGFSLQLRMQKGYDHSYFFIASFIEDHLRFHAGHLNNTKA